MKEEILSTKSSVKVIIDILKDKYQITEEDLISAELEIVPAFNARSLGFDSSMIAAYGQDDRVCAYTSLEAMLNTDPVEKTAVCILVDKEEIGSVGATGMRSRFFENSVARIMNCMNSYSKFDLRMSLQYS